MNEQRPCLGSLLVLFCVYLFIIKYYLAVPNETSAEQPQQRRPSGTYQSLILSLPPQFRFVHFSFFNELQIWFFSCLMADSIIDQCPKVFLSLPPLSNLLSSLGTVLAGGNFWGLFFWLSGYLVGLCRSLCLSVFVSVSISVCANVLQLFMYVFLGLIAPGPCKPSGLPNKVCLDFCPCLLPSFQFCLCVFFFILSVFC